MIGARLANPRSSVRRLYLVVHNIDGPALRDRTAQQTLAALAALPSGTFARVVMLGGDFLWVPEIFCGTREFFVVEIFCGPIMQPPPRELYGEYPNHQSIFTTTQQTFFLSIVGDTQE